MVDAWRVIASRCAAASDAVAAAVAPPTLLKEDEEDEDNAYGFITYYHKSITIGLIVPVPFATFDTMITVSVKSPSAHAATDRLRRRRRRHHHHHLQIPPFPQVIHLCCDFADSR